MRRGGLSSMRRATNGLSDQSDFYLVFQICQMHQVIREALPPALGGRGVGAGKMPRLPSLEISQPRIEVTQARGVVQSTPHSQRQCESPQVSQSAIEQLSTLDGCHQRL